MDLTGPGYRRGDELLEPGLSTPHGAGGWEMVMQLQIVGGRPRFPRAQLVDPPPRGYVHLAAVVEPPAGRAPFVRTGERKTRLLQRLKALATELTGQDNVERVTVYKAVLIPPASGYARREGVHHARYDVVVLIETSSPGAIGQVQATEPYRTLHDTLAEAASDLHVMAARCVKSLGDVDKTRPGLFLFNYFVADDVPVALELFEWLAGWYAVETIRLAFGSPGSGKYPSVVRSSPDRL